MSRLKPLLLSALSLLLLQPTSLVGQFLVFHAPGGTEVTPLRFSTPAEDNDALLQPASFDLEVTVILNPLLLNGPDVQALNTGLLSFFPKTGATPLNLVSLGAGEEHLALNAATRQQFLTIMKALSAAAHPDAAPVSFTALLDYLRSVPTSGSAWKQAIFAGPEPAVPAALRDYAYGILVRTLAERRIRLSHYRLRDLTTPSDSPEANGAAPAWSAALAAVGGVVFDDAPATAIAVSGAEWTEAKVPDWAPIAGFRVATINVRTPDPIPARVIPWVWTGERKPLPSLTEYSEFLERRASISKTLAGQSPLADLAAGLLADLAKLLEVNPYDTESLSLATDFADRTHDYPSAVRYAARIAEMHPADGPNLARLGFFRWQTGDVEGAGHDLLRARELHADHPLSAAILGDIHSAGKDYAAAAAEYQDAVGRQPERVELWLKLADTQQMRGRQADAAVALEEVLKRKPEMWDQRTQIVDYYLAAGDRTQALRQVQTGIPLLPADAALVGRFAGYTERLEQSQAATTLWSRVIELDRTNEPAYYSLARLQSTAGSWDRALATTKAGVTAVPASARLLALNVDALTALGRIDDARRVARMAARRVSDPALLSRTASFEDRYGADSPAYYKSLIEKVRVEGSPDAKPDSVWRAAAERGLLASIRERQPAACAWFAALIASNLCSPDNAVANSPVITIPGGTHALLFMARGPQRSSSRSFLADYSGSLAANLTGVDEKATEAYRTELFDYFRLLSELKAMGSVVNGKTLVRLSLESGKTREITGRVLAMLGWRSRRQNGKTLVEPETKGQNTKRQNLASALMVDVVAMQENLQSGKEFVLEIHDESVAVFPDENLWQSQFYPGLHYTGGFAEALVRNPEMASFYIALSSMNAPSADIVVASGMKFMAEKYGSLLTRYSSCLEMSPARVEVPGGEAAAPIWASLAGVSPAYPGRFLRALLDKDDGHLLRFYFLLSQLDFSRQRFFTANQKRTAAFYDVFRQSAQVGGRQSASIDSASIEDLFREMPLDSEGRILFPGGPEVWLVAKNQSSTVQAIERRLKKLSRVTTPDQEDDILLQLIRTDFNEQGNRLAAWQNFLAVVRIEAARPEPLDAASALLLTEKFVANRGLYGYFTGLTALNADHFREVLSFSEKIQGLDRRKTNIAVGLFQSVLYLLSAAEKSGRITPEKAAAQLFEFARAMNQAQSPSQRSHAALDFLGAYMDAAGVDRNSSSLAGILIPAIADQQVQLPDGHSVNPRETLRNDYARVLELQKVPPVNDLLKVHAALLDLSSGKGDARLAAGVLADATSRMQDVEIPKKLKLPESDLELLKSSQVSRLAEVNLELQKEVGKKKIDPRHLQEIADECWDSLAFRTVVALAGQIYAANFRSGDLLISEDPFFLRKHQFVVWGHFSHNFFDSGELDVSSDPGGSRVTGGFDRISTVAGRVAAGSLRDVDSTSSFVSWALLGSVRAADWSRFDQAALRNVAVQIHAAQDWLVLSTAQAQLYDAVGTATYGLLSLNRRALLLAALRSRDWESVWSSVSVTDLFFLAERLRAHLTADASPISPVMTSPAISEYMASAGLPPGADAMGPTLQYLRRRPAPQMVELPPYEQIANESFPVFLAERVAEFKIYLVRLFAREALPAAALPAVAEAATRSVMRDIQMTNIKDWQSVLDAYEGFDDARLKDVIGTL
jgi:tetratricopeptide (TPR) repeat protein